ncbi:hypothetical protein CEXT_761751 [Caerostris extrusa]|uniref:Uncharacterized protein n=1 Tax=Caerostris extrusa TaxID=172846 RepID=A0AAV4NAF7_CAEEX|nr:hypothetical protein CEXT_761751 [Caerostris extrusa]
MLLSPEGSDPVSKRRKNYKKNCKKKEEYFVTSKQVNPFRPLSIAEGFAVFGFSSCRHSKIQFRKKFEYIQNGSPDDSFPET